MENQKDHDCQEYLEFISQECYDEYDSYIETFYACSECGEVIDPEPMDTSWNTRVEPYLDRG
jgi:translation initiation factor 2 beta subunit (eIF-2beta)/eIF-5